MKKINSDRKVKRSFESYEGKNSRKPIQSHHSIYFHRFILAKCNCQFAAKRVSIRSANSCHVLVNHLVQLDGQSDHLLLPQ